MNIPRIGSFRNNHLADLPNRFRWLWSWMSFNGISTAVCNSPETRVAISAQVGNHMRVIYIPNGVQLINQVEHHRKMWREQLGIQPGEVLIVGVGRLTPQKNFARFVDAIALANQNAPIRAVIAGRDEGCQRDLERRIHETRLEPGTIQLVGSIPDARELICAADIFMLSSDYEGMPNVVLEAMAIGVPCVCTRVNGVSELIDDGVHGFTTDHCAMALASRVQLLIADNVLRQQMGKRAAQRVRGHYDARMIAARLWEMCELS